MIPEDEIYPEQNDIDLILERVDYVTLMLSGFFDAVQKMKDELEELRTNGITPGVQFLLFYYLDLMNKPILKNNTLDGKLLRFLFNSGGGEEYRRWLSGFETQRTHVLSLSNNESDKEEIKPDQPFTVRNFKKLCEILESLKLDKTIDEPFLILDKLESLEK